MPATAEFQQITTMAWVCWQNGCGMWIGVPPEDGEKSGWACPVCGEEIDGPTEVIAFQCSCGGWTWVNTENTLHTDEREGLAAVACTECGVETGFYAKP